MLSRRMRVSIVSALALGGVLAAGAVALASPLSAPVLRSPHQGSRVHAGVITLVVNDPGVPKSVQPVYVTISPRRSLDRDGRLTIDKNCDSRCDFVALRPWQGHPGMWIFKSPFNFPGYWAVTPGNYYWQANHVAPGCVLKGCEAVSQIQSFAVLG